MSQYTLPATGLACDMNAGAASAATQRVVLATDQPAVTVTSDVPLSAAVSGSNDAAITDDTSTEIIAASGEGVRTYVTAILVVNADASVPTVVEIRDGTAVRFRVFAAAGGKGASVAPVLLRGSANTAWNAKCVTTSAEVWVSLCGFTSTA